MEIVFTEQFDQAYEKLTRSDKRRVKKALSLLGNDPRHPSLYVKKMGRTKDKWEARASLQLRMTFEMTGETIAMRNVGHHDKVIKNP